MILMSILLPALNAAKGQARRISCASNLKQLGTCFYSYYDDYKVMPPTYDNYTDDLQKGYWTKYLADANLLIITNNSTWPQAYNCKLLYCPADNVVASSDGLNHWSYGMNFKLAILMGLTTPTANHQNRKSAFIDPARINGISGRILLGDDSEDYTGMLYDPGDIGYPVDNYRHNLGANFLYLDGHVAYQRAPIANYSYAFGITQ